MSYDFDTITDRTGTSCLKYDFAVERGKPADILPLWVADMDFPTAPAIRERLAEVAAYGIYGYSDGKADYFAAIDGWYTKHFGWSVQRDWVIYTPGVVFALAVAVRAFTAPGDGVLIQQPVYYPFTEVITDNDRVVVNSSLVSVNGRYQMDLADFEEKIIANHVRLFLLCSPHNPVGRVWTKEELLAVGDICKKHDVTIVSDEIHSDFVWEGHTHHVLASLSEDLANRTVVCTAPTKTFNLAGLQISNIIIPNEKLRKRFKHAVDQAGYSQGNLMGLEACKTAYTKGDDWYEALKVYLQENIAFVRDYLVEHLPQLRLIEPEGTYLLWIDCRGLGLSVEALEDLIVHKAGLWLDSGAIFGADGEGFQRINVACPRVTLQKALERLERAIVNL